MTAQLDESGLQFETLSYPLSPAAQSEVIRLLRTEWTRTDYDWLEAMNGDYSEHLVIETLLVRASGNAVAAATIHFARNRPEIAVLGNVLTHPEYRGHGLAGMVIERALARAQAAGCKLCLLGTAKKPRNVYHHHGFAWQNGSVMRRTFDVDQLDDAYFAAGQPARVRPAHWGDLGDLAFLLAYPLQTACLDYPRGLFSGLFTSAQRCLSNFPVLWSDTAARGGLLAMLAAPDSSRVFGFGSVTLAPGSARKHTATIDLAVHETFTLHLPALLAHLLDGCRTRALTDVHAYVADGDDTKLDCLRTAGFVELARFPDALRLERETRDVVLLNRKL